MPRVLYAASRVFVTRTVDGRNRLNAPLLLGYGVAAGMNNLYYPDQDTGARETFKIYAGSLPEQRLAWKPRSFSMTLSALCMRKN